MHEKDLKFADLTTVYGIVDHQHSAITAIIEQVEDLESKKFLKEEQAKYKRIKGVFNKLIKNY
jgi:hypothetical protein